jgi:hypothetical protein
MAYEKIEDTGEPCCCVLSQKNPMYKSFVTQAVDKTMETLRNRGIKFVLATLKGFLTLNVVFVYTL